MKRLLILFFFFSVVVCNAQTTTEKKILPSSAETSVKAGSSTETSVKEGSSAEKPFLRIIFDDSNSQLLGIDTSGKIIDNAIIAFQLYIKIKGVEHSEQALGSFLNKPMLNLLAQAESNTILYFEHIQVMNAAGNLIEADDFQYTLSYLPKEKK